MNFDFPYTQEEKILLRTWQQYQADCFVSMHRFMEAEGLTYWMDSGTLLGAVRHKGFIPWDDDLDAVMPEEDFSRLAGIIRDNPNAGQTFGIRLSLNACDPYHIGVSPPELPETRPSLDIFCVQRFRHPRMTWTLKWRYNAFFLLAYKFQFSGVYGDFLQGERRWYPTLTRIRRVLPNLSSWKKRLLLIGLLPFMPLLRLVILWAAWLIRHLLKALQSPDGETISYHGNSRFCFSRPIMINTVFPLTRLEFEGYSLYAPRDPHEYVSSIYGKAYSTPPPFTERLCCHYTLDEIRQCVAIISEGRQHYHDRNNNKHISPLPPSRRAS